MYICLCNAITERDIRAHAAQGVCTLADLEQCLGVGAGCGRCRPVANELLSESHAETRTVAVGAPV